MDTLDDILNKIERDATVIKWMRGFLLAMEVAIFLKVSSM
jgi:hypothetical protein